MLIEQVDFTLASKCSFETGVEAVKQAATAQGFNISHVHDIQASLKKGGIDYAPYAIVEVCSPQIAFQVLDADPRLGGLMPCRVAVYPKGDETVFTTVLPSKLISLFPEIDSNLMEVAVYVDGKMRGIVEEASKAV